MSSRLVFLAFLFSRLVLDYGGKVHFRRNSLALEIVADAYVFMERDVMQRMCLEL